MSEHQRIAFRAVDGPVSEKNLEYMRRQSSRAEITPWAFDNEYHYGDFGGNAVEMLRRGYDLHLHYANFGVRKLMIRLPQGLPDFKAAKPYFGKESLKLVKDKQGPGGILSIEPYHEPGDLDDLWEIDDLVDRLIPLRGEILDGDLRPLYLAHLAVSCGSYHDPEETREGPVPAGLKKLSDAQRALMDLYGLDDSLIAAAAQGTPPLPAPSPHASLRACGIATPKDAGADPPADLGSQYAAWLAGQPASTKDAWLAWWMSDPHSTARSEIMAEFRKSRQAPLWPAVRLNRTIAELQAAAEVIHQETARKAAAKAARQKAKSDEKAAREKAKRIAALTADPAPALQKTEELVRWGGVQSYQQIASLLDELRDALAGSQQSDLAEQQARKLKKQNPTLNRLTSELRRKGFLVKGT